MQVYFSAFFYLSVKFVLTDREEEDSEVEVRLCAKSRRLMSTP